MFFYEFTVHTQLLNNKFMIKYRNTKDFIWRHFEDGDNNKLVLSFIISTEYPETATAISAYNEIFSKESSLTDMEKSFKAKEVIVDKLNRAQAMLSLETSHDLLDDINYGESVSTKSNIRTIAKALFKQYREESIYNSFSRGHEEDCVMRLTRLSEYILSTFTVIKHMTIKEVGMDILEQSCAEFKYEPYKEIQDALARRYAILDKPGKVKNLILDSFLPKYFIKHNFNTSRIKEVLLDLSPTVAMIHRGFASMFEIKAIPIHDLILMLGYTQDRIKTLLTNVKEKDFSMCFIGLGGVGTNTMNWLTEMCQMCNIQGLFRKVIVYENDRVSVDNLFRMPMKFKTFEEDNVEYSILNQEYYFTDKFLYGNDTDISSTTIVPKHKLITDEMKKALSKNVIDIFHYKLCSFYKGHIYSSRNAETYNWILYGAPDIETRNKISQVRENESKDYLYGNTDPSKAFILATHGNNNCSLDINPVYDNATTSMITESYGIIQLNVFFMNQLKLAISLLEFLASHSYDEIKEIRDMNYLSYSFLTDKKASNKYNVAFQNISTINTVENIQTME